GSEPQECAVFIDAEYRELVWETVDRFWHCVETLTPPVPLYFPRVVAPEEFRRIDLDADDDQPNWANEMRELLATWEESEQSAKFHEATKAQIKELFPVDCGRLTYAHYTISRARNNAVTIRKKG